MAGRARKGPYTPELWSCPPNPAETASATVPSLAGAAGQRECKLTIMPQHPSTPCPEHLIPVRYEAWREYKGAGEALLPEERVPIQLLTPAQHCFPALEVTRTTW